MKFEYKNKCLGKIKKFLEMDGAAQQCEYTYDTKPYT